MRTLLMWVGAFALGYGAGVIEKRLRARRAKPWRSRTEGPNYLDPAAG